MADHEEEYRKLKERYQEVERRCVAVKTQQQEAEKVATKLEVELIKMANLSKFSVENVEGVIDKLDKEIETRLVTLRDKTRQLENSLEDIKVEGIEEEPMHTKEQVEDEDIEDIFRKI